ncbi:MAG: D-alanine--D-alanine ligase [Alphaproteobacteria bacterium]|nr:D-alanine--D-alanine ligase [Alphaproteobacteria bacterium]
MRIGFVYDSRAAYLAEGYSLDAVAEFDTEEGIAAIGEALTASGCAVVPVGHGRALAQRLAAGERFDLVFSIAEGLAGRSREAQVPALCEMFAQPYVFSDPLTMAATLDKAVAKRLIRDHGIPTAAFAVLADADAARTARVSFPAFVKPLAEGTGKGCEAGSLVRDRVALGAVVERLVQRFDQPAIAEAFLPGREFTIGITGTAEEAAIVAVMEIHVSRAFDDGLYTFDNKEHFEDRVSYTIPEDAEAKLAGARALAAYRALQCRDAARLDFRSDGTGSPHFLEANPIAGLNPFHSDLPMLARLSGRSFDWLIGRILQSAAARYGLAFTSAAVACAA